MFKYGQISAYKYRGTDTVLQVTVPQKIHELSKYATGGVIPVELRINDGRTITVEQRKKAYATINDIAAYTGHIQEFLKEYFKYELMARQGIEYFSLSDCSVTLARNYINILIEFCIAHGVQLQQTVLERTDDIARTLITCLIYRKCCICGRNGEEHHVDAIGMGNDRKQLDDSEHEVMCLCRKHHTDVHTLGVDSFCNKYKVFGIKKKYIRNGV
jgi:hypothetical protein